MRSIGFETPQGGAPGGLEMVTYRFGIDDLAAMRFSLSPMYEMVMSLLALRDRDTAAMHLPWLRAMSGQIDGDALRPIVALVPVRGYEMVATCSTCGVRAPMRC